MTKYKEQIGDGIRKYSWMKMILCYLRLYKIPFFPAGGE